MEIGQVIRKYRKIKNLTQEEMADRLGVSAPAVNKWENGNSFPDIMLLAPIARLLDITPDTLLMFREEMTEEEMDEIARKADGIMREGTYEEAFRWVKRKVEEYPGCERLMARMAVLLDAEGMFRGIHEERYEDVILKWYRRALESKSGDVRAMAADGLFGFYRRKGQYEKAEECLAFFPEQDPERKWKQAELYRETGKRLEAYKAYEELLFSAYQRTSVYFYGIYRVAVDDGDMRRAHMAVEKMGELAKVFDMGEYYQVSGSLELAAMEKDEGAALDIMEKMISGADNLCAWTESELYEHMTFREVNGEFVSGVKRNLMKLFRDEESFGFLNGNDRWKRLVEMDWAGL